mmetsp:Transcript_81381/g.230998  ORF Transcript_81381/g.230998 Transcript_81381/m.230998 type:complete len:255 (-) Transcript_81381:428-1192(-)
MHGARCHLGPSPSSQRALSSDSPAGKPVPTLVLRDDVLRLPVQKARDRVRDHLEKALPRLRALPPDMRREDHIVHFVQRAARMPRAFHLLHVQRGTGNRLGFQRSNQVAFHDQPTPADVDEVRGRFHEAKLFCIDHASRVRVEGAVEAHKVRAGQELVETSHRLNPARWVALGRTRPDDHLEPERLCELARGRARVAKPTNEPKHLAGRLKVRHMNHVRVKIGRVASLNHALLLCERRREGQNKRHRQLAHLIR